MSERVCVLRAPRRGLWRLPFVAALLFMMSGPGVGCATAPPAVVLEVHEESTWQAFDAPRGAFTIELPAEPEAVLHTVDSVIGPQKLYTYRGASPELAYFEVGYVRRSSHPLARLAGAARQLQGACSGTLERFDATVLNRTERTINEWDAVEFEIELPIDGVAHRGRLVMAISDQRIYHLLGVSRLDAGDTSALDRLFESFVLPPE